MLEKKDKLSKEELDRIDRMRAKDEVTNLIISNIFSDGSETVDLDLIDILEKRSFVKMEYYIAAEVFFNQRVSNDWITLVLNVIHTQDEEHIVTYIREIVRAYQNRVDCENLKRFMYDCSTPAELSAYINVFIHQKKVDDKVFKSLEDIPDLFKKIEKDSQGASQNFDELKRQLDEKDEEICKLKRQLEEKENTEEDTVSKTEYDNALKDAEFFKNKYKTSQTKVRELKSKFENVSSQLDKAEQQLKEKTQADIKAVDTQKMDALKKYLDERISSSIAGLAKTVSSSYSKILDEVQKIGTDEKQPQTDSSDDLKKIISQNETIYKKIQDISNLQTPEPPEPEVQKKVEYEKPSGEQDNVVETGSEEYEINESDIVGEMGGDIPDEIIYGDPDESGISSDGNNTEKVEDEEKQPDDKAKDGPEIHKEPDINMCKASEYLDSKVLSSKVTDDKEEKKIGFFARIRFKHLKDKKQKQLILDMMLHKKLPIDTVTNVKNILNSGKVDNAFVFDLINSENVTDEVIRSTLEFVS